MIRVQIYLTETEKLSLESISHQTQKSQSELIRQAIDQFIEGVSVSKDIKQKTLEAAAGLWANRTDVPDFREIRASFDRKRSKRMKK